MITLCLLQGGTADAPQSTNCSTLNTASALTDNGVLIGRVVLKGFCVVLLVAQVSMKYGGLLR